MLLKSKKHVLLILAVLLILMIPCTSASEINNDTLSAGDINGDVIAADDNIIYVSNLSNLIQQK